MPRVISVSVSCAVCGEKSKQMGAVSRYVPDHGLDSKPYGTSSFLMECPHCHYIATDIATPVSETVRKYVNSSTYIHWFSVQTDPGLRKREGAAMIAAQINLADAGRWRLAAAWYCEDHNMPDKARENRLQYLKLTSQSGCKLTPDDMLPYLDSLRQLGMFEEAMTLAEQIQPAFARLYDKRDLHQLVLQQELNLIKARDISSHMISEVK